LLTHSNFGLNQTTTRDTLHKDLHVFLWVGMARWGIHSQLCNHVAESPVEILLDDVINQAPDLPPMQGSLTPDNSDVAGAIHRGQFVANAPELLLYAHIS
jgi:hypothetical protein